MNAKELYQLMDEPTSLDGKTLGELKQIVDDFPCFNIARMLYLKNLSLEKDIRFRTELKRGAIYISDRKQLFLLIEGENYQLPKILPDSTPKEVEKDSFHLIDTFLSARAKDGELSDKADASLLIQPSVSSDYIYWTLSEKEEEEEGEEVKMKHQDLIDSFIEKEDLRIESLGGEEKAKEVFTETDGEDGLDDSFFTETLAHIYVKQKRYVKALQIIRNLSLKYPEKNSYFADQIRFLEKLIINSKK